MNELIRREDCCQQIDEIRPLINTLATHYHIQPSKAQMFIEDILHRLKEYMEYIPTIATDEVIAYKCPECHEVNIIWDNTDEFCPNCGIKRRY